MSHQQQPLIQHPKDSGRKWYEYKEVTSSNTDAPTGDRDPVKVEGQCLRGKEVLRREEEAYKKCE